MFAEVWIERKQRQQFVTFFDECATAGNQPLGDVAVRHALVEFDLGHVSPMLIDLALERSNLALQRARFIQCHLPRVLDACRKLRHT